MSCEIWENFPRINFWLYASRIYFSTIPTYFCAERHGTHVTGGKMEQKDQDLITVKVSYLSSVYKNLGPRGHITGASPRVLEGICTSEGLWKLVLLRLL